MARLRCGEYVDTRRSAVGLEGPVRQHSSASSGEGRSLPCSGGVVECRSGDGHPECLWQRSAALSGEGAALGGGGVRHVHPARGQQSQRQRHSLRVAAAVVAAEKDTPDTDTSAPKPMSAANSPHAPRP